MANNNLSSSLGQLLLYSLPQTDNFKLKRFVKKSSNLRTRWIITNNQLKSKNVLDLPSMQHC